MKNTGLDSVAMLLIGAGASHLVEVLELLDGADKWWMGLVVVLIGGGISMLKYRLR